MAKIILGKVIGPEGKAATIEIDSTETVAPDSPAVVENVGTANEARLKFSIPQGAKGDTGATPNLSFEVKSLEPEDAPTRRTLIWLSAFLAARMEKSDSLHILQSARLRHLAPISKRLRPLPEKRRTMF